MVLRCNWSEYEGKAWERGYLLSIAYLPPQELTEVMAFYGELPVNYSIVHVHNILFVRQRSTIFLMDN